MRWDWENDGTFDTQFSTTKTNTHKYSTESTFTIKLEVKDTGGLTDNESKTLSVSNGGTGGTVTDYDGNVYQTVTIGTQTWMAENLKVTHYSDGSSIPNVTDNTAWGGLSTGAYCWYNNDIANKNTYGALYNWYAVNTAKLAPAGWHVPTDAEWKQLEMALGMTQAQADATGWRGTDQGTQLKNTSGWNNNGNGTNTSGFSALPGGYRYYLGYFNLLGFSGLGEYGRWWSATEYSATYAWGRTLGYSHTLVSRYDYLKPGGFSVRCVRD